MFLMQDIQAGRSFTVYYMRVQEFLLFIAFYFFACPRQHRMIDSGKWRKTFYSQPGTMMEQGAARPMVASANVDYSLE